MTKLSKKNIKHFWACVDAALKDLKLLDWNIQKLMDPDLAGTDTLATCAPQWQFRKATIHLNPEWAIDPSPLTLCQIAAHEVYHILFAGICELAGRRYVTEKQLDEEEHEIIRRLVPVITGKEEVD